MSPYVFLHLLSAAFLSGLGLYCWLYRTVPVTASITQVLLLCAGLALDYAFDLSSSSLPDKLFWMKGRFFFLAVIPVLWLVMIVRYIGQESLVTRRRLVVLFVVPAITIVLALTSEHHTLFRYNYRLDDSGLFPILLWNRGPWYWIHICYSYGLFVASLTLLLLSLRNAQSFYRRQSLMIIGGASLPVIADAVFHTGIPPLPGYIISSSIIFLAGIMIVWALFRYAMLNVVPIARSVVLEKMSDIMIVLDGRNHVVDFNAAAHEVFGLQSAQSIGRPLEILLSRWPDLLLHCQKLQCVNEAVQIGEGASQRFYDLSITTIQDRRDEVTGRVIILRDVTGHKRTEEALRENEEKYRLIAENMADIIAVLDMNLRFTYISPSIMRIRGFTVEEAKEQTLDQVMTPESLKIALTAFEEEMKLEAGGTADPDRIRTMEVEQYRKDGSSIWIEVSLSILRDENRKAAGILSVSRDISERKRAEETLRKREEQYRLLAENVFDVIWIRDMNFKCTHVSPSIEKLIGYTVEEAMNLTLEEAFTPDSIAMALEVLQEELALDKDEHSDPLRSRTLEAEFYCKDGSKIWTESVMTFLRDSTGQVYGIQGVSRDITKRKRTEEALRESEVRYRLLAENATDVIWTIDMNLNLTYISPSVKQVRGYTVEEAMAQTLSEIYTPESLAVVERVFAEEVAIENQEQKDLDRDRTFELEYKCKDGSTIWSEVKISFIRDSSGMAVGILGVGRNIARRKKIEKEKAELQQQLQQSQKMEAIGRLAGGIAHDFNNLLTVIKGYCDLALLGLKEEGPLRRAIEEINKAGDQAAILTHQLLAFSRRQILESKIVNLNDILRNLNKMLQRLIGEDIELVMILGEGLGNVKVDPGQMEQVIMNLAVNARDAMPMGGGLILETSNVELGKGRARSHVDLKAGSYVMLSVRDTGIGITPEVKEHIFEPFFTTKERGKGTGLGLSMVYGMVNQSGGSIGVESELGRGTTFKIYFPQVAEGVEELEARPVKQEIPRGSETILVVEDNKSVRDLASQILKKQGYWVLEAPNGEKALDLYEMMKEPIHLVLTDVVMPRMSGRELADHLISLYPEVKILYMSGYTDEAIVHHGVLEEGVSYIQKPFTMEGLAKKVREVLDKELS